MKSYTSESTVRPEEWDKTSSTERVYHNQNIVEHPATEDRPVMYSFDVDEYERVEYLQQQNAALEGKVLELETSSLTALEAIAEIYETTL